jgi:hypothetical protein
MYPWREAEFTGVRRPSRTINVDASKGPGSNFKTYNTKKGIRNTNMTIFDLKCYPRNYTTTHFTIKIYNYSHGAYEENAYDELRNELSSYAGEQLTSRKKTLQTLTSISMPL